MTIIRGQKIYKDADGQELDGVLYKPKDAKTKLPAILVLHAFLGISEHEEKVAKSLAKLGFVAFCADVFGKGVRPKSIEETRKILPAYRTGRSKLLRRRLLAAFNYVKTIPEVDHDKISAIGFCFGGLCAIDLARINCGIKCAVSFHGSYDPIEGETDFAKMKPMEGKLLILHGDEDEHLNPAIDPFLEELRQRKADFQFVRYAGAKHGFTMECHKNDNMPGVAYCELTAKRSFNSMLMLFNELYGIPKLEDFNKFH